VSPPASRLPARLLGFILLTLGSYIAFQPAVDAGFSDFDDHGFLVEPTFWRGLSPAHLKAIFTTPWGGHYQPLTYLSHAIEGTLAGGMKPHVFHFTNIVIHALNSCLFWRLAVRLLRLSGFERHQYLEPAAFAAAAIWAVHPLRVETVAWITERRDVLSSFFLLLATHAYISATAGSTLRVPLRKLALTLLFLTLSLFSKAWGITFVAIAILLDVLPLRRLPFAFGQWFSARHRSVLIEKLPFVALSIIFGTAAHFAIRAVPDSAPTISRWGLVDRICQACYGLCFYIWKSLVPIHHSALYELPSNASPTEPRFLLPILVVLVAGFGLAWFAWKRPRFGVPAAVVALLYVVIVSPVIGLSQAGIQLVAERYTYLSTMPLLIGLVALVLSARPHSMLPLAAAALSAIATLASIGASHQQSAKWKDVLLLWEQALANGQDGPVLRNYYGRRLERSKQYTDAEKQYLKSLEFNPAYGDSWNGLGTSRMALGRLDEAKVALAKAIDLLPNPLRAHNALGMIARSQNEQQEAIRQFALAVECMEKDPNLDVRVGLPYLMLASAYGEAGQEETAEDWLLKAWEFGQLDGTRRQAQDLFADPIKSLYQLAMDARTRGDRKETTRRFAAAVAILEQSGNPGHTGKPYLWLGSAHAEAADAANARTWLTKAATFSDVQSQAQDLLAKLPPAP
jgi:tetratricopeptide (TPR) repeat protein